MDIKQIENSGQMGIADNGSQLTQTNNKSANIFQDWRFYACLTLMITLFGIYFGFLNESKLKSLTDIFHF